MTQGWNRRAFLAGVSAAGLGTHALPSLAQAQEPPPLPIPPLLEGSADRPVDLAAQGGTTEFFAGRASPTAGYNGSFLGPTIRMRSGTEVPVRVRNELAEPTTVHWHGLLIPAAVDGGPHNEIAPGAEWSPVLPVRQPAMTGWYHAHPHMRTGPQVYAGLAGMLLVTDREEEALRLPSRYGVDDLPLILQDRAFDRAGSLVYPLNPMTRMHGVHGNVMLVNGVRGPRARVPSGLVRLRLLNGANARVFDLAFQDGRSFQWIASDAGLLREPVTLDSLELAPGQRAEIVVDFSKPGDAVLLHRTPQARVPMLSFAPSGEESAVRGLPATLARWDAPKPQQAVRRRRLTLTMGMAGMGMGGMGGMGRGMGMMGHGIDGRPFDMARIDHDVRLGDVEIWEVSSQPGMMMDQPHPFHMHGVHFEVLSRDGRKPDPLDAGRRDTVLVDAPVELLVHFTQPAPRAAFMYHCHILEHEDAGMMGQFRVS